MKRYFARRAFLPDGWAPDVAFDVDSSGTFVSVEPNSTAHGATPLSGCVVPGVPNMHSHAFQRALAGRTERRSSDSDTFWTWREEMYALVERLTPDAFEAVTALAFVEMLEAGYTSVAEFHYVHNDPDGRPYPRRAELGERVIAAARTAGIGLTLLPVVYRTGDFGGAPLGAHQRRFWTSPSDYAALWRDLAQSLAGEPAMRLGFAPHSLRAVSLDDLRAGADMALSHDATAPIHIHVSEQQREVERCRAWSGKTPIELLAGAVELGPQWCLVHATHATALERERAIGAGSVVCLCPTTEANLGDGVFPAAEYIAGGGRIALGSDSNVSIDAVEELRWLEYGQRLAGRRRAAIASSAQPSVGESLFRAALSGGAQASGRAVGALAAGFRADFVVLAAGENPAAPALDEYVFRSGAWRVRETFVSGRRAVHEGRHIAGDVVRERWRALRDSV